jgi:hypothetical protein
LNIGEFKIKIFNILLFKGNFSVKQNLIEIRGKDKNVKINLNFTKKQLKFIKIFNNNLKSKIYLDGLYLDNLICMEDAFACSMLSGVFELISNILISKIKCNNEDVKVGNIINSGFRHNLIIIKLNMDVYISLFDLVWAIMVSVISNRGLYNEKSKKRTMYRKQH